jgi:hypothetical protein
MNDNVITIWEMVVSNFKKLPQPSVFNGLRNITKMSTIIVGTPKIFDLGPYG